MLHYDHNDCDDDAEDDKDKTLKTFIFLSISLIFCVQSNMLMRSVGGGRKKVVFMIINGRNGKCPFKIGSRHEHLRFLTKQMRNVWVPLMCDWSQLIWHKLFHSSCSDHLM